MCMHEEKWTGLLTTEVPLHGWVTLQVPVTQSRCLSTEDFEIIMSIHLIVEMGTLRPREGK